MTTSLAALGKQQITPKLTRLQLQHHWRHGSKRLPICNTHYKGHSKCVHINMTKDFCSALDPHRWCGSRQQCRPHLCYPPSTHFLSCQSLSSWSRVEEARKEEIWRGKEAEKEREESLSSSTQLQHVSSSDLAGISI